MTTLRETLRERLHEDVERLNETVLGSELRVTDEKIDDLMDAYESDVTLDGRCDLFSEQFVAAELLFMLLDRRDLVRSYYPEWADNVGTEWLDDLDLDEETHRGVTELIEYGREDAPTGYTELVADLAGVTDGLLDPEDFEVEEPASPDAAGSVVYHGASDPIDTRVERTEFLDDIDTLLRFLDRCVELETDERYRFSRIDVPGKWSGYVNVFFLLVGDDELLGAYFSEAVRSAR